MIQTTVEQMIDGNEQVIDRVSAIAAKQAIIEYEKHKERAKKLEYNKRLRNAKILLKHYRELKTYVEKIDKKAKASVPKLMISEKENLINLLEFGDDIVSSIKESSQRTIVMIQHLDNALETLEFVYKKENNARQFNILKKRYVEGMTINALADMFHMNNRSIYKVLDTTSERLAILLFGVYGIKLE